MIIFGYELTRVPTKHELLADKVDKLADKLYDSRNENEKLKRVVNILRDVALAGDGTTAQMDHRFKLRGNRL